MSHVTENDLRTVLAERSAEGPGWHFLVAEIVKEGRAMRLRRRIAAGAAVVGVVAAVTGVFGVTLPLLDRDTTAKPATSARVSTGVEMPETVKANGDKLSLIYSQTYQFVGQRVRVAFRPTSNRTGTVIRCADPKDWVLELGDGSAFSRCGDRFAAKGHGLDTQHSETYPGWVGQVQIVDIWVFPADAPVAEYGKCKVPDPKRGTCDGKFTVMTITENPERLAAAVGRQPGLWSVGIYDTAEGD
ncbi:hypothetical protein [Planotetraspora kaengkrachanensis]|uniref:Uncharacterized protein n=1 Tax=Planotetraspora kaengkrachanensis TaxID=575193 RepID=A0A8J3LSJ2_9ACTN|nr:hypothetical protein [Planotetraspora kaengkrachanensis]GIG77332.1 hypothetical protein Pka01_04590 [Planotetraspora kaengkrachanensis]